MIRGTVCRLSVPGRTFVSSATSTLLSPHQQQQRRIAATGVAPTEHAFVASASSSSPQPSPQPSPSFIATPEPGRQIPPAAKLVDFEDGKAAYKSKSTIEILKALIVFRLCTVGWLVKYADRWLGFGEVVLGKYLVNRVVVKKTFFDHFCAGENIGEVQVTLSKLRQAGVGAILDYAAENDLPENEAKKKPDVHTGPSIERMDDVLVSRQRKDVHSARIYDYAGEAECDANLETVLQCIDHASQTSDGSAFCAVKLTALCKPALLERMSALLMAIRRSWVEGFSTAHVERSTPLEEFRTVVSSPDVSRPIGLKQWKQGLARICKIPVEDDDAERMFNVLKNEDGLVDYLDFTRLATLEALSCDLDGAPNPTNELRPFTHSGALPILNDVEMKLLANLASRINAFAAAAVEKKVNVMVDAEQTYLQVAIDHFTLVLQRVYNREEPRIYNTYQCYLDYSKMRILNDLERSRREGWKFAGKIVRGAYMVQERELARKKNYASPIFPDIESTHRNFDECLQILLHEMHRRKKIGVLVGSHNQHSIEKIIETMDQLGISKKDGGVYFGQLLGMADQLTFPLGQSGYNVYKYVPYGPLHEVMPYLIRRAQENSSMTSLAEAERTMLAQELRRRLGLP